MNVEELIETPAAEALRKSRETKNPLRKMYFWTLHWADTRFALPALVVLSFLESSFFPIPPDVLLMAMCFANAQRWLSYAFWCTVASVAGAVFGWMIGYWFWEATQGFFFQVIPKFTPEVFATVEKYYQQNAFLAIVTAAFTPIPFKVFTVASGVFHVPIHILVMASLLGRGARFFAVAGLIRLFGPRVKPFLEKHFELATFMALGLGVLGIFAIKWFSH